LINAIIEDEEDEEVDVTNLRAISQGQIAIFSMVRADKTLNSAEIQEQ